MEIVAFCHGSPYDPHTWSGSNRGLFSAMRARGVLGAAIDVELTGLQRYLIAAREFSWHRPTWAHNFLKSPLSFAVRSRRVLKTLRRRPRPPDAILQIGALFDAAIAQERIPRFCYLDSNCALSARAGRQSFSYYARPEYKMLARARERDIYATSAGIFVFSEYVRRSLIDDFSIRPERIHVVYAGINMPAPSQPVAERSEPLVLFVGKDFERKGGPVLLRAFARVRRACPDARLVIAGCDPPVTQPGVEVVGFIDKRSPDGIARLASLYQGAAVFTLPSRYEPFGIVFAEAMHHGLPCVGINHCAMPEIIVEGKTGVLVPAEDEYALADALTDLLKNPQEAQRLGAAGITRAQALFNWDAVAGKMAETIARTCGQTASTPTTAIPPLDVAVAHG